MGAMSIKKGSCMPSGKIAYHYHLRYSNQLHGSAMAINLSSTILKFSRFLVKKIYVAIYNAMRGYVCFCLSRPFFTGRNRIRHTSPQM